MKSRQAANSPTVLVLNDDRLVRKSLYEMLCRRGYSVDVSSSLDEALAHIDENPRRVVLADNSRTGIELLKAVKEKETPSPIIILTSDTTIESAVECKKTGAFDYLVRPVEDAKVISAIEKAFESVHAIIQEFEFVKGIERKEPAFFGLVGTSPQMKQIHTLIERIAPTKATILLRGESGTGKRMVAHAIHMADKRRRDKPFIEISCGALPREIVESELFGHTRGAFTGAIADRKGRFEMAHGGTILLDDIDSFSLDLQVKLLRVLQHKEFEQVGGHKTIKVDVHVIVSTNQDLEKAIAEKHFREDLYYRLNVISIHIPPLRERKEDLLPLVEHFVRRYSQENHKKIGVMTSEARQILVDYHWPGNIRELENIIERAVILDTDNIIDKDDLPEVIHNRVEVVSNVSAVNEAAAFASLKDALKEPEKVYILKILEEAGWNKKKAAKKLGLNRTTLYNKLKQHNLISHTEKE